MPDSDNEPGDAALKGRRYIADFAVLESPAASEHADTVARLRDLIASRPGLSQGELLERHELPEKKLRDLLRRHEGEFWRAETGPRGSLRYFPVDHPEDSPSEGLLQ